MANYDDFLSEERRAAILMLLDKVDGTASENAMHKALRGTQFPRLTGEQLRADLEFLRKAGCITEEWLNVEVLVATLTARGQNAARGDIEIEGIARPERIR